MYVTTQTRRSVVNIHAHTHTFTHTFTSQKPPAAEGSIYSYQCSTSWRNCTAIFHLASTFRWSPSSSLVRAAAWPQQQQQRGSLLLCGCVCVCVQQHKHVVCDVMRWWAKVLCVGLNTSLSVWSAAQMSHKQLERKSTSRSWTWLCVMEPYSAVLRMAPKATLMLANPSACQFPVSLKLQTIPGGFFCIFFFER